MNQVTGISTHDHDEIPCISVSSEMWRATGFAPRMERFPQDCAARQPWARTRVFVLAPDGLGFHFSLAMSRYSTWPQSRYLPPEHGEGASYLTGFAEASTSQ